MSYLEQYLSEETAEIIEVYELLKGHPGVRFLTDEDIWKVAARMVMKRRLARRVQS